MPDGRTRVEVALRRILDLSEAEAHAALADVAELFGGGHQEFEGVLERSVVAVGEHVAIPDDLSEDRRRLIGVYFTHEYSVEAAALGNPSIVPSPDQTALDPGSVRFVMSLRAIGEGHISSIEFRTGVLSPDMSVTVEDTTRFASTGTVTDAPNHRPFFAMKLAEMGAANSAAQAALNCLGHHFTHEELEAAIELLERDGYEPAVVADARHTLRWLASSNYRLDFGPNTELSERVIFPVSAVESRGMEDVRLVRFVDDDGQVTFFGTYTAFDGHQILPQMLETQDFSSFRMSTMSGGRARNKGIALFPRRIDGDFVALGRHDNLNNFLMRSDDVRHWDVSEQIQEPKRPWELMQLGNCGSPLETEAGWLVITHGVGPFRRYSLGALLLDLDDPVRVIGHLQEPLLSPADDEREGYVPNVVYSCGSMLHADHLVVPYGFADTGATVMTTPLAPLLDRLTATAR